MNNREKKLWKKVFRYCKILRFVPFLKMVAVCNNLAFGKTDEKSDIDFFIVAEKGRLFTVRILVTGLLHILAVRRHGNKVAGRFCLSFFVDEENLDLSQIAIENDIYLAYWIRTMIPVIDDDISGDFLVANSWAKRFFEEGEDFVLDRSVVMEKRSAWLQKFFTWILNGKLGDFFEEKMKNWQLRRAGLKASLADISASLIVSEHILKFHNIDRRREYRNLWIKNYGEQTKLSKEKLAAMEVL